MRAGEKNEVIGAIVWRLAVREYGARQPASAHQGQCTLCGGECQEERRAVHTF